MTCRKCQGFLAVEFGEGRCVNCGRTYTAEELADAEAVAVVEEMDADDVRGMARTLAMQPPFVPRKGGKPMATVSCRSCEEPKADDSVFCVRHRDMKRAANERMRMKRGGLAATKPRGIRRAATPAAATGVDGAVANPESEASVVSNGHGSQTVRQVAIGEIDAMIHHLQRTKRILEAFPVVE